MQVCDCTTSFARFFNAVPTRSSWVFLPRTWLVNCIFVRGEQAGMHDAWRGLAARMTKLMQDLHPRQPPRGMHGIPFHPFPARLLRLRVA